MSRAAEMKFAEFKLAERRKIDEHLEDGSKWLRSRLSEVKANKSRTPAGDDWLRWHAAECALMEEIATRQNRGRR